MKLTLHPTADWQIEDQAWTSGPLRVETVDAALVAPLTTLSSTIVTRDGWTIAIAEFSDATTAYLIATIELAGETAAVRAQCPLEHVEASWPRLIEILQTARPSWPETVLLSDLLALPATAYNQRPLVVDLIDV